LREEIARLKAKAAQSAAATGSKVATTAATGSKVATTAITSCAEAEAITRAGHQTARHRFVRLRAPLSRLCRPSPRVRENVPGLSLPP